MLAYRDSKGIPTEMMFVDSPGGEVDSGHDLAQIVRTRGIPVAVYKGSQCTSACFMIFAAAPARYFTQGVSIEVHSASTYNNEGGYLGDTQSAQATTLKIARYLKWVGTPDALITAKLYTPPENVTWLTTIS